VRLKASSVGLIMDSYILALLLI